jgi:hypothetical protein
MIPNLLVTIRLRFAGFVGWSKYSITKHNGWWPTADGMGSWDKFASNASHVSQEYLNWPLARTNAV